MCLAIKGKSRAKITLNVFVTLLSKESKIYPAKHKDLQLHKNRRVCIPKGPALPFPAKLC